MTRQIPITWWLLECGHYGHNSDKSHVRMDDQRFVVHNCRTCFDLIGKPARRRAVRNDRMPND